MASYHLATDKQLFVGGVVTTLKAGNHETKDKDLIKALDGALGVNKKQAKPTKAPE